MLLLILNDEYFNGIFCCSFIYSFICYSFICSFQIYTFCTFCYFIESSKVWKKPKYNFLFNINKKCLVFDIDVLTFDFLCDIQSLK